MSSINVFTDFILRRQDWLDGMDEMSAKVDAFVQKVANPVPFNVTVDPAAFNASVAAAVQSVQAAALTVTLTAKFDQSQAQAALDAMTLTANVGVNPQGGLGGGGGTVNNYYNTTNNNTTNNNTTNNGGGPGKGKGKPAKKPNRRLVRTAIRGSIETLTGGVDLIRAGAERDPAERAKLIRSDQSAVGRIPYVGGLIVGAGEGIEGLAESELNRRSGRHFETDETYAKRTTAEADYQDRDVERRSAIARRGIAENKRLGDETAEVNDRTQLSRLRGEDAIAGRYENRVSELDRKLKEDPAKFVNRNTDGKLTAVAQKYRDAEVGGYREELKDDLAKYDLDNRRFVQQYGTPTARNDQQRLDQFRAKEKTIEDGLREESPTKAAEFQAARPQREAEEQQRLAATAAAEEIETVERVADVKARAIEAGLRAAGHGYEADTAAYKREQDKQLEVLRSRLGVEQDERKRAGLTAEIKARETANPLLDAARKAEHDKRDAEQDQEFVTDADAIGAEIAGDPAKARRLRRERAAAERRKRLVGDRASDKTLGDFDADQRAIRAGDDQRENEHYRDLEVSAQQTLLRSHNRSGEADVIGVLQRVRSEERRAGDDPDRLRAAKLSGQAQLDAIQQKFTRPTTIGLGLEDVSRTFNERSVSDADYGATMTAVRKASDNIKQKKVVDAGDGGGFGALNESFDKFGQWVDKLLAADNELYVLKDN